MKIQVKVKPNSKVEEVSQERDSLIVKVKKPPKEGRANQTVIKVLAKHFGVPQSQVKILSGFIRDQSHVPIITSCPDLSGSSCIKRDCFCKVDSLSCIISIVFQV